MKWCEHCRSHYSEDHYDEKGLHRTGDKYGFYGFLLACRDYVVYRADEVHDPKAMELMKSE